MPVKVDDQKRAGMLYLPEKQCGCALIFAFIWFDETFIRLLTPFGFTWTELTLTSCFLGFSWSLRCIPFIYHSRHTSMFAAYVRTLDRSTPSENPLTQMASMVPGHRFFFIELHVSTNLSLWNTIPQYNSPFYHSWPMRIWTVYVELRVCMWQEKKRTAKATARTTTRTKRKKKNFSLCLLAFFSPPSGYASLTLWCDWSKFSLA